MEQNPTRKTLNVTNETKPDNKPTIYVRLFTKIFTNDHYPSEYIGLQRLSELECYHNRRKFSGELEKKDY